MHDSTRFGDGITVHRWHTNIYNNTWIFRGCIQLVSYKYSAAVNSSCKTYILHIGANSYIVTAKDKAWQFIKKESCAVRTLEVDTFMCIICEFAVLIMVRLAELERFE